MNSIKPKNLTSGIYITFRELNQLKAINSKRKKALFKRPEVFMVLLIFLLSFIPSLVIGSTLCSYDEFNRLTRIQYENSDTIVYDYDSIGNRSLKEISSADSSFTVNTPIENQELYADQSTAAKIDLSNVFGGDGIAISVSSSDTSLITASLAGKILTLTYINQPDNFGRVTINIEGRANGKILIDRFEVVIRPGNSAPALDHGQFPALQNIDEDDAGNIGNKVSEIVANGSITDADVTGAAPEAIAVTGINNTNGIWEFSVDNGGTWQAFHNDQVTIVNIEKTARLLDENDWIRFVPNPNRHGTSNFTFRAWDKTSGDAGGTYDASSNGGQTAFSSSSDTASVTVSPVNDPPVAEIDSYNTPKGIELSVAAPGVLDNDTDPDSDRSSLTASLVSQPSNGSVVLNNNGSFVYTADNDFNGTDTFTYKVSDGTLDSNEATVIITVDPAHTLVINDVSQQLSRGGDPKYSGAAVADMILNYLNPTQYFTQHTTDERQEILMAGYGVDVDGDEIISISGLRDIMNNYLTASNAYNYGISTENVVDRYGAILWSEEYGAEQNRVNQFIMHWVDYNVSNSNAPEDRMHGPAAVVTSSDPQKPGGGADSDYNHWMSIVGYSSDIDPHTTPWEILNAQLNGFVVSDPAVNGLGSYKYIQANEWNTKYFRPIKNGLEGAGRYGAVVEPPETENNVRVVEKTPGPNPGLVKQLNTHKTDYVYTDFWLSDDTSEANASAEIKKRLMENRDFIKMLKFDTYRQAFKPENVGRVIKVESAGGDYALILFEKNDNGNLITTGAAMVSLSTGSFKMGFPNPRADFFDETKRWKAICNVYAETGNQPINAWPALFQSNALDYGYKVVTPWEEDSLKQFNIYQAEKDGAVFLLDQSPSIELLSSEQIFVFNNWRYESGQWHNDGGGKENGFYKRLQVKITDDNKVADVKWPDSFKLVAKTIVNGGYIYEFICGFDQDINIITAADKNYKGSCKSGGISYFYLQ